MVVIDKLIVTLPTEEPTGSVITEGPTKEPTGSVMTEGGKPVTEGGSTSAGPASTEGPTQEPTEPPVTEESLKPDSTPATTIAVDCDSFNMDYFSGRNAMYNDSIN